MQDIFTLFAAAPQRRLSRDAVLFHTGDPVRHMHLIDIGAVSLERRQPSGQITCFQRAGQGDVLAEASLYAPVYHCDARALSETCYRRIDKADFQRQLDASGALARDWARHLAHLVQRARLSAEIRSFKTVAERLDAWIDAQGPLPAKGQWHALADTLAVSPEALYRELARRRQ